jgi:diguanylate cyclase (GGDEF)-like protein
MEHVDALTELPSRAALDSTVKSMIEHGESVALAVLDVDCFLEVNDSFGYDVGDRVLQALADLLSRHAPDAAYRISGDEFAVVLPNATLEQAFLRMEALRANVQEAVDHFDLPGRRAVTVTIGVAQVPRDGKDLRGLLSAADAALEAAKEAGRNQVGLPPNEEMVMKSCYYSSSSMRKLKELAKRLNRKESHLLREALDDLLRKYDLR